MTKLNCLRTALVLSVVLLLCGADALTNVSLAQRRGRRAAAARNMCKATTDEEIVAAVQEKIKGDTRFDDQHQHILVYSSGRVVTLYGWVKGHAQANDLIKYALTTKCVRAVKSEHLRTFRSLGGCIQGQKQCGDVCIPRDQACNLIP